MNSNSGRNTMKRRQPQQRQQQGSALMFLYCTMLLFSYSSAYTMHMEYKPPVQSSVSKLRNSRFRSSSTDTKTTRTSNRAAASYAGSPQDSVVQQRGSFEDRMRGLVFGKSSQQKEQQHKKAGTRQLPPNVMTVESLEEYKHVVGEESSKVVAVRFFAPWCKACKAVQPLFYHMANKFPNVIFVDVPVTDKNTNLHQGLGVPSLPYGHIYHPTGGLVEELRFTRKFVPHFARKLQNYVMGSCELQGVGDVTNPYPSPEEDVEQR